MKICAAQIRPVKGDIQCNIDNHLKIIELAVSKGAAMIIFPELSLTGYEPGLAKELATTLNDSRFDVFQKMSDTRQVIIGAGVPTKNNGDTCISMVIFQPHKTRQLYTKKFLHPDEEPFFAGGQNTIGLTSNKSSIAFAICYELSVPVHAEEAFKNGANVYIASVAKSAAGIEKAAERLAGIAGKYAMTVLMPNCVGYCDNFESGGRTSIWNNRGLLAAQLNDTQEGILVIDTDTQEIMEEIIK